MDIPSRLGPAPVSPARRLLARTLLEINPKRTDFSAPMTQSEAAHAIESAFNAEIAKRIAPVAPDAWPLRITMHLSDDAPQVGALIAIDAAYNLTPDWTADKRVPGGVKNAVWTMLKEALPNVLPVGDYEFLYEHAGAYYWDNAETDEEAKQAIAEYGGDPEDTILPSELKKAIPHWVGRKYARTTRIPARIRKAIAATRRALRAFRRNPNGPVAWHPDYTIATSLDPSYDEVSSLPPLFLIPLEPVLLDVLDSVADSGMQTGFFDICGAANLTSTAQIKAWLDSLSAGARLLAALAELMAAVPPGVQADE